MIDYVKRAFYKPNWKLAVRESNEEYNPYNYEVNYWCADPFIIKENDSIYVFCEYCHNDSNRGTIAVGEYKNGVIENMSIIIEQAYHMSYPCVFKYNSTFFMIPETADNNTIELYRAIRFPYEWELVKILMKNIKCVDSTVFMKDEEIFVVSTLLNRNKNKICIFKLDMENEILTLSEELDDDGTGRPAGNILYMGDKLIRPTQISKRKYGEGIAFKEIMSLKSPYSEKTIFKLLGKDILVKGEKRVDRIHTFNKTSNVEIIDYSVDSFMITKPLKLIFKIFGKYI